MPIRKVVDRDDLELPQVWTSFIASDENKRNLANYLSDKVVQFRNTDKEVVVGGAETGPFSSKHGNLPALDANHKEADTTLILHALHAVRNGFERIVVQCWDTDILLNQYLSKYIHIQNQKNHNVPDLILYRRLLYVYCQIY